MKKTLRICALALCICLLCLPCASAFDVVEKSVSYYVADYAGVIEPETENYIVNKNNSLSAQTGAQIVVVAVDFLDGAKIEEYSTRLFNEWAIGDSEKNNGLLLLLAVGEQEYWATQGTGIYRALTSSMLDEYLYNYLEPDFAKASYDSAVRSFFDAILGWYERYYNVKVVEQEQEPVAPEGMETFTPSSEKADASSQSRTQRREVFQKGGMLGRLAGWFLLILLIIAIAAAALAIVPRWLSLRRRGVKPNVFSRSFWSLPRASAASAKPRRGNFGIPRPVRRSEHVSPPPRPASGGLSSRTGRPEPGAGFSRPARPASDLFSSRPASGGLSSRTPRPGSGSGLSGSARSSSRSAHSGFSGRSGSFSSSSRAPRSGFSSSGSGSSSRSSSGFSRPSSSGGLGGSTRGGGAGRRAR